MAGTELASNRDDVSFKSKLLTSIRDRKSPASRIFFYSFTCSRKAPSFRVKTYEELFLESLVVNYYR